MASRKRSHEGPPGRSVDYGLATVRFERPRDHNRIDPDDIPVLRAHLERVTADTSVRVVVFTGAGERTFSSGFTIEAILDRLDRSFEDLLDAIEALPLPTIAVVNGGVYGGATDLALCCDFRIGVSGRVRSFTGIAGTETAPRCTNADAPSEIIGSNLQARSVRS